MIRVALFCLAMLANAANANVLTTLDPAGSRIDFSYTQMGVAMEGRFTAFTGKIAFDPANPQTATASIDVKLGSVDTGFAEADTEVAGKDWFDTTAYPVAHFESSVVRPLGGNRYQIDGRLTIKGRTRTVSAPFLFMPDAAGGSFVGTFTIRRADFAIGEGTWRDFSVVGNEIAVRCKLRINN